MTFPQLLCTSKAIITTHWSIVLGDRQTDPVIVCQCVLSYSLRPLISLNYRQWTRVVCAQMSVNFLSQLQQCSKPQFQHCCWTHPQWIKTEKRKFQNGLGWVHLITLYLHSSAVSPAKTTVHDCNSRKHYVKVNTCSKQCLEGLHNLINKNNYQSLCTLSFSSWFTQMSFSTEIIWLLAMMPFCNYFWPFIQCYCKPWFKVSKYFFTPL